MNLVKKLENKEIEIFFNELKTVGKKDEYYHLKFYDFTNPREHNTSRGRYYIFDAECIEEIPELKLIPYQRFYIHISMCCFDREIIKYISFRNLNDNDKYSLDIYFKRLNPKRMVIKQACII